MREKNCFMWRLKQTGFVPDSASLFATRNLCELLANLTQPYTRRLFHLLLGIMRLCLTCNAVEILFFLLLLLDKSNLQAV